MNNYVELLKEENEILRKKIAFLENNRESADPSVEIKLREENNNLMKAINAKDTEIASLKLQIVNLNNQEIDYEKVFIDTMVNTLDVKYLGCVDQNDFNKYGNVRQSGLEKLYYFMLSDGHVIPLRGQIVHDLNPNNKVSEIGKGLKHYPDINHENFGPNAVFDKTKFINNKDLENFVIAKMRSYGYSYCGKGTCMINGDINESFGSDLFFDVMLDGSEIVKWKGCRFKISQEDIMEHCFDIDEFILYEGPKFLQFCCGYRKEYYGHTITEEDDGTKIIRNKDGKIVKTMTPVNRVELNKGDEVIVHGNDITEIVRKETKEPKPEPVDHTEMLHQTLCSPEEKEEEPTEEPVEEPVVTQSNKVNLEIESDINLEIEDKKEEVKPVEKPKSGKKSLPKTKWDSTRFRINKEIYDKYKGVKEVEKHFSDKMLKLIDDHFCTDMTYGDLQLKYGYTRQTIGVQLTQYMNNLKVYLNNPEEYVFDLHRKKTTFVIPKEEEVPPT